MGVEELALALQAVVARIDPKRMVSRRLADDICSLARSTLRSVWWIGVTGREKVSGRVTCLVGGIKIPSTSHRTGCPATDAAQDGKCVRAFGPCRISPGRQTLFEVTICYLKFSKQLGRFQLLACFFALSSPQCAAWLSHAGSAKCMTSSRGS